MAIGSILLAILGIGLLIFLHEGGHFLAARMAGVRVEVFSLGFGPRLGGFQWRGTDFRLSAVPFGGYVMVAGQDPGDRRYPASMSLWSKSPGQRALFWSGGVIMNLLFALIVFPLVFNAGVKFEAPLAGIVPRGSAAWEAGIEVGERIVEVAGKPIYSFQNQQIEVALHGNRPVELLLEGERGDRRVVTVLPHFDKELGLYSLGLRPAYDDEAAILTIDEEGPAALAGLKTGDRVLALNGRSPIEPGAIAELGLGELVIKIQRDGKELDFSLIPTPDLNDQPAMIGVAPMLNIISGIRPGCALAERLHLQRGDRVLAIDDLPFLSGKLDRVASGTGDSRWLVLRDGTEVRLQQPATPEERANLVEHVALELELGLQISPAEDGAAWLAGVQSGDWVQSINGTLISDWDHLRKTIKSIGNKQLTIEVLRPDAASVTEGMAKPTGKLVTVTVTPVITPAPDFGYKLAMAPKMIEIRAESFGEAVKLGTVCSIDLVKQMYVTLKRLVTG